MSAVAEPEVAAEGVEHAAEHGEEAFDAGGTIMHHILDQDAIDIPFSPTGETWLLPEIHLFGIDFSITRAVVMMWLASAILILFAWLGARKSREPVPRGLRNLLEIFILFIRDEVARKAIGPGADRYLGYLLTTFFFILTCNLLGLVPGMATATGSISVTASLAIMAFLMIQFAGIRENGVFGTSRTSSPHGLPCWSCR